MDDGTGGELELTVEAPLTSTPTALSITITIGKLETRLDAAGTFNRSSSSTHGFTLYFFFCVDGAFTDVII